MRQQFFLEGSGLDTIQKINWQFKNKVFRQNTKTRATTCSVLVGILPDGCAGAPLQCSPQSGPAGEFLPVKEKKKRDVRLSMFSCCIAN